MRMLRLTLCRLLLVIAELAFSGAEAISPESVKRARRR
jgi:uncharacterized protein YlxW (UPF0749 family)